jgi:small subunit ribosomal protein S17
MTSEVEKRKKRFREGIVVSDKMDKTISVKMERMAKHPVVKKIIRRATKVLAYDEENKAKLGDKVRIVEARPLSKQKRWRLEAIL